jgi:hypothetical protein
MSVLSCHHSSGASGFSGGGFGGGGRKAANAHSALGAFGNNNTSSSVKTNTSAQFDNGGGGGAGGGGCGSSLHSVNGGCKKMFAGVSVDDDDDLSHAWEVSPVGRKSRMDRSLRNVREEEINAEYGWMDGSIDR